MDDLFAYISIFDFVLTTIFAFEIIIAFVGVHLRSSVVPLPAPFSAPAESLRFIFLAVLRFFWALCVKSSCF